jgi:RNA polymerase sigma-70 factor (ECF subfamily)
MRLSNRARSTRSRPADDVERRIRAAVVAAQAGDRDAMARLYLDFAPSVRAHAARIVGPHDADDVAQQVFLKLMSDLPRYRPGAAPFSAWLMRVAHNVAVDHRRRGRELPVADLGLRAATSDERRSECIDSLREALAPLTVAQREVLLMQHVAGLSAPEIAGRMGRSAHSVHCLHHRAQAAARTALAAAA